ncbi:MAG: hypothetical protein RL133_1893 [Pseudomonadota bacterium]
MWPLENVGAVASTQQCVRDRLLDPSRGGASRAFGLFSLEQRAGVGQHGRHWVHAGEALACSLAWPLEGEATQALASIPWPICVSTLISSALERRLALSDRAISIKWPNDLYFEDKKCGGVLVSQLKRGPYTWLIAGIGLNLRWHTSPTGFTASALLERSHHRLDEQLGLGLVQSMAEALEPLRMGPPLACDWAQRFRARDWLHGKSVDLIHPVTGAALAEGIAQGIDERGWLSIRHAQGEPRYFAIGEVSARPNGVRR